MRENDNGQAVYGMTMVSFEGTVPPALAGIYAGNPQFLALFLIICQAYVDGAWKLVSLDLANPQALLNVESEWGQNYLFAGAGVWARILDGVGPRPWPFPYGYLDSLKRWDPDAAPVAVDNLTGDVAVAADRGRRFEIWHRDGTKTLIGLLPDSWQPPDIDFHNGVVGFRIDGYAETFPPRPLARVPGQSIRMAGGAILTYQSSRGLIIHFETSVIGIALHLEAIDGHQDFSPDMVRRTVDGMFIVKSCRGKNELPNELREYVIDLVRYTVNGESRPVEDLSQPRPAPEPGPGPGPEPGPGPGPGPNPEPTPEPDPMTTRGFLRRTDGQYLYVDPNDPAVVWAQPGESGAWGLVDVTKFAGGFSAQFVDAKTYLSVTNDGDLVAVPVAGAWEELRITEQPPDWKTRFVYRHDEYRDQRVVCVLIFEERA